MVRALRQMKKNLGIRCRWQWLRLPTLAFQFLPNEAWAAQRPRIPLVEVVDFILKPAPWMGRRIGVLAVVLRLDQGHCLLADQASAKHAIGIDTGATRHRRRLVVQCLYTSCIEILIGVLSLDTSAAAAPFETKLSVSSPRSAEPPTLSSSLNERTPAFYLTHLARQNSPQEKPYTGEIL